MKETRFSLLYLAVAAVQLCFGNFLYLSQYLMINLLPGLMLCFPLKRSPERNMLAAFLTGLAVDFLGDGMLGLTAAPLVVVALLSRRILLLCGGGELFFNERDCPPMHLGKSNLFIANLISAALFFIPYVLLDGAGTRPFFFNLSRIIFSTLASAIVSQISTRYLFASK